MAQQDTPATSPRLQQPRQGLRRAAHGLRIGVAHFPQRCAAALLLAGLFMGSAGGSYAAPVASAGALLQAVPLHQSGAGAVGAGVFGLSQSPRPDWITGLVEFLSAVPPECSSVSKQNTEQKCQQRQRGVLERFKNSHPVAFNLCVAGLTLLAGFYLGGGFKGGE